MIVYSLLFTLEGKDPSKNKYIDMFYIWLTFLLKYGGLTEKDKLCLLCDDITLEEINSYDTLASIIEKTHVEFEIHSIPRPKTISEGICSRYICMAENEYILFLDLDILVLKDLSTFFESIPQDSEYMLVMPEGKVLDSMYGGEVIERNTHTETHHGYTAGWFVYKWGPNVKKVFENIKKGCLENIDKPFYTIDQPFFNKEIYNTKYNKNNNLLKIYTMDDECMENNTYNTIQLQNAVFVNYCGEPGDGDMHYRKVLSFLFSKFLTRD